MSGHAELTSGLDVANTVIHIYSDSTELGSTLYSRAYVCKVNLTDTASTTRINEPVVMHFNDLEQSCAHIRSANPASFLVINGTENKMPTEVTNNTIRNWGFEALNQSEWVYFESDPDWYAARLSPQYYTYPKERNYVYMFGNDTPGGQGPALNLDQHAYAYIRQTGVNLSGISNLSFNTEFKTSYDNWYNISVLLNNTVIWSHVNRSRRRR